MQVREIILGCDPEFFIRMNGNVVGSEVVIGDGFETENGKIIIDGVQAEINPMPNRCREVLNRNIATCLSRFSRLLGGGLTADFSQSVSIGKEAYDNMSSEYKQFGCKPSFNTDPTVPQLMELDPSTYLVRSAGGHIHLGGQEQDVVETLQNAHRLVPVLDLIVGNTCVLLDRSEGNIERRKHYGRAGEYRLPSYGIEYRVLSNFWLRSPVLASLVFGLARHAVQLVLNNLDGEIMAQVDYELVRKAINNNDYDLAMANLMGIKDLLLKSVPMEFNEDSDYYFPLDSESFDEFIKLATDGIDKHIGSDVIDNWMEDYTLGFHDFVNYRM